MVENNKTNLIAAAILIAGFLIGGAIVYVYQGKIGKIEKKEIISSQEAGEKVISYIDKNILQGQATSSLKEIKEESGLYKMTIKIGDQEFPSYLSPDGKLLFTQAIDLEEKPEEASEAPVSEPEPKETPKIEPSSLEAFAKCLTEKGAKFYGAYWCGWCKKQKELFKEAAKFLPYIECIDKETNQMTSQCQSAGISGFPTWEFPEKGKSSGYKSLEQLAELSGCPL